MNNSPHDPRIEPVIRRLKDADPVVRLHAAMMLGAHGDAAEPAVPALIEMLHNGDVHDRRIAALTLGEIGPAAAAAVSDLLEAADEDDDETVAGMALVAVDCIDGSDAADEAA